MFSNIWEIFLRIQLEVKKYKPSIRGQAKASNPQTKNADNLCWETQFWSECSPKMKTPGPQSSSTWYSHSLAGLELNWPTETTLGLARLLPGDTGQVATQVHKLTSNKRDGWQCHPHSEAVTSAYVSLVDVTSKINQSSSCKEEHDTGIRQRIKLFPPVLLPSEEERREGSVPQ